MFSDHFFQNPVYSVTKPSITYPPPPPPSIRSLIQMQYINWQKCGHSKIIWQTHLFLPRCTEIDLIKNLIDITIFIQLFFELITMNYTMATRVQQLKYGYIKWFTRIVKFVHITNRRHLRESPDSLLWFLRQTMRFLFGSQYKELGKGKAWIFFPGFCFLSICQLLA